MRIRPRQRRGVVLLMVVIILVMFMLIGMAFVILAGQFQRGAAAAARRHYRSEHPVKLTDNVLYQLLRDTQPGTVDAKDRTVRSRIHGHSLLRDLYGNDGIIAYAPVNPLGNGTFFVDSFDTSQRFIYFVVRPESQVNVNLTHSGPFGRSWRGWQHAYNGCVITFLSGPLRGHSTHIISHLVTATGVNTFGIRWQDDMPRNLAEVNSGVTGPIKVLINGRPFNGTGFGYDANAVFSTGFEANLPALQPKPTGSLDDRNLNAWSWAPGADGHWGTVGNDDGDGYLNDPDEAGLGGDDILVPHAALMPRVDGSMVFGNAVAGRRAQTILRDHGGADESYDAVDYQNMALAAVRADANQGVVPSFHRPGLINYWLNRLYNPNFTVIDTGGNRRTPTLAERNSILGKIILRPMPWDHPKFTGSNPARISVAGNLQIPQLTWAAEDVDGDGSAWDLDNNGVPILEADAAIRRAVVQSMGNANHGPLWDVDNDRDGVPDSVWIDAGFPVKTGANGRPYKPLVAILVKDMDGRLNLNAHGNRLHLNGNTTDYPVNNDGSTNQVLSPFWNWTTAKTQVVPMNNVQHFAGTRGSQLPLWNTDPGAPRGSGYGPAEVWYGHLLSNQVEYHDLLMGRYARDQIANVSLRRPGFRTSYFLNNADVDLLSRISQVGLPARFGANAFTSGRSYASRSDVHGVGTIALNHYGQPWSFNMGDWFNQLIDDPYELDLSQRASRAEEGIDSPYSVAELERVLRWSDLDATSLPDRLVSKSPTLGYSVKPKATVNAQIHAENQYKASRTRAMVTTDSWSLPVPQTGLPRSLRSEVGAGFDGILGTYDDQVGEVSLIDWFRLKLIQNGVAQNDTDGNGIPQVDDEIRQMVAFELLDGGRLNLNRLLGNGIDNNDNGVVDEPGEGVPELLGPGLMGNPYGISTYTQNPPTAGNPFTTQPWALNPNYTHHVGRRRLAHHLYSLLRLLDERNARISLPGYQNLDGDITRKAYALAQWAINVVDFRDPDVIMTPFEFDLRPFNGSPAGGFDGIVGGNSTDDNHPDRGLVWGCERPELLITETLAWHDRRTENLQGANHGKHIPGDDTSDIHFDQRFRPRGAFFVELYNPWVTTANPVGSHKPPAELYSVYGAGNATTYGVQLNRRAANTSPVWRMMVVSGASKNLDPNDPSTTTRPAAADIEKYVYFTTPQANSTPATKNRWTQLPLAQLEPGRYAVVGTSGRRADVDGDGANEYVNDVGLPTNSQHFQDGNNRQIVLDPNVNPRLHQVRVRGNQSEQIVGAATTLTQVTVNGVPVQLPTEPTDILLDDGRPRDILNAIAVPIDQGGGLTVSEPPNGYPIAPNGVDPLYGLPAYSPSLDEPLDRRRSPANGGNENAVEIEQLLRDGTWPDHRVVHLQRLANPLLPWNTLSNPYLTIDTHSVDLTTFNGVAVDEDDPEKGDDSPIEFASLERGDASYKAATMLRDVWAQEINDVAVDAGWQARWREPGNPTGHFFPYAVDQTLGYLNRGYHPYFLSTTDPSGAARTFVGAPDTVNPLQTRNNNPVPDGRGLGLSRPAFPWLVFHDRPFANPLELLQVPLSRASRLTQDFSTLQSAGTDEQYEDDEPSPFGHLLAFFETAGDDRRDIPHYYRLFDFVETPSPFVGTRDWGREPDLASLPAAIRQTNVLRSYSRFRDPGRVNFNTIFELDVFRGLAMGFPAHANGGVWRNLVDSRRGYSDSTQGTANPLVVNGSFPTLFGNPLRSAFAADLTPDVANLRKDSQNANDPDQGSVQATLLRSREDRTQPLFRYQSSTQQGGGGGGAPGQLQYHDQSDRNSYFRYHGLERLSNLVSAHSNVYAVWITVGYFEVEPWRNPITNVPLPPDVAHPDGWQLSQEVGLDSGEVTRHRSFYLIDRSIPVGFEPGENHNVDRAILIRRPIE